MYDRVLICLTHELNLRFSLQKPNIKLKEKFLSLEAYGFGAADNGPHEYYFEINLFESIDVEVRNVVMEMKTFQGQCLIQSLF